MRNITFSLLLVGATLTSCAQMKEVKEFNEQEKQELSQRPANIVETAVGKLEIPAPFHSKSIKKLVK